MKVPLIVGLACIAAVSDAFAQSEGAKKAIAEAQSAPAAMAGKALLDCLLEEVDKAKQVNLSREEFGKFLVKACPEQVDTTRKTLAETGLGNSEAVDFALSAVRARAYQAFTGVANSTIKPSK